MNSNKFISNKILLVEYLLALPFPIYAIILILGYLFESLKLNNILTSVKLILFILPFIGIIALILFMMNRLCCFIWVEDNSIKRRGFFCGYYRECRIIDIKNVVIKYSRKESDFIYIVDEKDGSFGRTKNNCYISFKKTKTNIELLKGFWHGNIDKI